MTDVVVIGARRPRFSRGVPIRMATLLASAVLLEASPQEARLSATPPSVRAASESSATAVPTPSTRPQAYYGRRVTLRGVVGRVYGPQIFSLDDGTAGPGVLIVLPGELEDSVAEGLEVIVTGTARAFVDADVGRELGSLDAPPELVATLSRRPVVVARTATRADGTTLLRSSRAETSATAVAAGRDGAAPARTARGMTSGPTGTDATSGSTDSEATRGPTANGVVRGPTGSEVTRGVTGTPVTNGPSFTDVTRGTTGTDVTRGATGTDATNGPTTSSLGMPGRPPEFAASADRIAGSPERYVGRRVLLTADVSRVESEGLFALEPGVAAPDAVLVLNPRPSSPPAPGARVTVSGTVRPFSREELGPLDHLPADAEALLARYAGRPVVVADSIRTSDGRELVVASWLR
jgi:hypothetical protein